MGANPGGMYPPNNPTASPNIFHGNGKFSIRSNLHPPQYQKIINFAKSSPPHIKKWPILLNRPPSIAQHRFAPLVKRSDFRLYDINLLQKFIICSN